MRKGRVSLDYLRRRLLGEVAWPAFTTPSIGCFAVRAP